MAEYPGRLRFLSLCVILLAGVLVVRLYDVQIVSGSAYKTEAERQYFTKTDNFDRGSLYFSTKTGARVPAASVEDGFFLSVNTAKLPSDKPLEEIYTELSSIINIDKEDFLARASRVNRHERIAERLDAETAEKIRGLGIAGLDIAKERWRTYPGGVTASHAIGLIGYKGDELAGRYGLERYYEGVLGRGESDTFINFFAEIFSNIKKSISTDESLEGDIVTHLEPAVEGFLENELKKVSDKYSADFSGGLVINPKTGEIFAMALYPTFDPNNLTGIDTETLRNKFVEDRYEMGSILKTLTMSIGLDTGAVTSRTTYNDPGCMTLNTKTFCNYDLKSRGTSVTMQEVLNQSLNTGAAHVVSRVGQDRFAEYMKRFGLGELTGIDLPSEGKGLVANLSSGRDLELAQASFGQGIALTPINTVQALSAVANGGTLVTPHLAKEVRYKIGGGKTFEYVSAQEGTRVISTSTSEEISRMLTEVVDRSWKNGTARLENYSIAAKTGTAQIANPNGGGYYENKYFHSLFGYFPAYDPEFLVFFFSYDPKGVRFSSETLMDPFLNTAKFLINYYEIPPDRESAPPAPRT